MQETKETRASSQGQEDPVEREMATLSSYFLPGKVHRQRSLVDYKSMGSQRVRHN